MSAARILPALGAKARGVNVLDARSLNGGKVSFVVARGSVADFRGTAIVNAANVFGLGGGGIDGIITKKGGVKMAEEREALPEKVEKDKMSDFFDEKVRISEGGAVITSSGLRPTTETNDKGEEVETEGDSTLKCEHVIHTVGTQFDNSDLSADREELLAWKKLKLAACYTSSLDVFKKSCGTPPPKEDPHDPYVLQGEDTSIAFALISAGIFRGPLEVEEVLEIGIRAIDSWVKETDGAAEQNFEVYMVGFSDKECDFLLELTNKVFPKYKL